MELNRYNFGSQRFRVGRSGSVDFCVGWEWIIISHRINTKGRSFDGPVFKTGLNENQLFIWTSLTCFQNRSAIKPKNSKIQKIERLKYMFSK